MIELNNIVKTYDMGAVQVCALGFAQLCIAKGEFLSIVGPSGSGKSTLLHILGALDQPSEGEYLLEGLDITELDDRELSRIRNEHFGFVFQSYNLFPELTAWENAALPLLYAGVRPAQRKKRAQELLQLVEMSHRQNHYPTQLSGGEQQRVAVARAMANEPTLVLADEPTGNLASKQAGEVLALFHTMNENGVTIVLVTHSPEVAGCGKRLITMRDGTIAADKSIEQRFPPADTSTA